MSIDVFTSLDADKIKDIVRQNVGDNKISETEEGLTFNLEHIQVNVAVRSGEELGAEGNIVKLTSTVPQDEATRLQETMLTSMAVNTAIFSIIAALEANDVREH